MTCRIARTSECHAYKSLASCCACGSANLDVCATFKMLGPHLCGNCTQSRVDLGVRKMGMSELEETGSITTSPDVSKKHILQTAT